MLLRSPLSRFVREVRVVSDRARPERYVRLPDGELELVVRLGEAHRDAYAIGTRTRALEKTASDISDAIAVRFRAGGAYPFFGVPMSELTDRVVSIDALWRRGAELRERWVEAPDEGARVALVGEALTARLRGDQLFEPDSARAVRHAIQTIDRAQMLPRVAHLARSVGTSERQLLRGFRDVLGVGPKHYLRIVRFQRALRAAQRAKDPDWSAIATGHGYCDQSHLIADFHAMAGMTPTALLGRSGP